VFGYYGKVPAHGDFIRRRADVEFVAVWDAWLQAGFAASRQTLGAQWDGIYENAPIWRFCFGPKICGPDAMIGVMMPSQDRVGRRFPLTLFKRLSAPVSATSLDVEPFMTQLEDMALLTLSEQSDQTHLAARLDALSVPAFEPTKVAQGSHWLSTFYGGKSQRASYSFDRLPMAQRFADLLNPKNEGANV
jgi:type VI secretion system protein ImpM